VVQVIAQSVSFVVSVVRTPHLPSPLSTYKKKIVLSQSRRTGPVGIRTHVKHLSHVHVSTNGSSVQGHWTQFLLI